MIIKFMKFGIIIILVIINFWLFIGFSNNTIFYYFGKNYIFDDIIYSIIKNVFINYTNKNKDTILNNKEKVFSYKFNRIKIKINNKQYYCNLNISAKYNKENNINKIRIKDFDISSIDIHIIDNIGISSEDTKTLLSAGINNLDNKDKKDYTKLLKDKKIFKYNKKFIKEFINISNDIYYSYNKPRIEEC